MLLLRRKLDDSMLDFHPELLSKVASMRLCKQCREGIDTRINQLSLFVDTATKSGIDDIIGMDFIRSVSVEHTDATLITLSAFIASVAQGRFRKPARSARKLILTFMQSARHTLKQIAEDMTEVPEADCQWHNQPDAGMMDDQGDEVGQIPPNDGPSMFG